MDMAPRNLLVIGLLPIQLAGCPQEWHLAVTELGDSSHPRLCVSQGNNCSGAGVYLSSLIIAEVNEQGRYAIDGKLIRPMWSIEPTANVPLREFIYGRFPEGWKETRTATSLILGESYSANEQSNSRSMW